MLKRHAEMPALLDFHHDESFWNIALVAREALAVQCVLLLSNGGR